MYTEQIRPIIINKEKYIKLPLSNLTRTSIVFNKIFEDELINKFIKESDIKKSFDIYFKIPKLIQKNQIRQIINYAIKNEISEIIIGYNTGFKNKGIKQIVPTKSKKRINQNFIQIPLSKLKDKIKYLCKIYGIKFTQINESYTSICSFYDSEEIKYHKTYMGKRITRSLFETKDKRIINADINGALNIMAKSKTDRYDIISYLRNRGKTVPIRQKIIT